MALKRLTLGEMITTTKTWIDARSRHHQLLKAVAEVAPLLPRLEVAHKALLSTQPVANPQAAERMQVVSRLDDEHDDLVRSLYFLLKAKVHKTQDLAERAVWESLSETLLPEGLAVVNRSPADEAGQAGLALARLTAEDKSRLKGLTFDGETAWKLVESYGKVGEALGQAVSLQLTPAVTTSRAEAATAKNQWIRVVGAIRSTLEMVGPSAEVEHEILGPLAELERRADRRRTAEPDPSKPPAGSSTPATPTETPPTS